MVEFLIRRGARVDPPDGPPWAKPVTVAAHRGHDAVVRLLTDYEKTGALPPRARVMYEALATDLADAFSGNGEALRRVVDALTPERLRALDRAPLTEQVERLRQFIRDRLGLGGEAEVAKDKLEENDAKDLVARAHGHENWDDLVKKTDD